MSHPQFSGWVKMYQSGFIYLNNSKTEYYFLNNSNLLFVYLFADGWVGDRRTTQQVL